MYSFFDLSGTTGSRMVAAAGALIITAIMMATAIIPASPTANIVASFSMGALA